MSEYFAKGFRNRPLNNYTSKWNALFKTVPGSTVTWWPNIAGKNSEIFLNFPHLSHSDLPECWNGESLRRAQHGNFIARLNSGFSFHLRHKRRKGTTHRFCESTRNHQPPQPRTNLVLPISWDGKSLGWTQHGNRLSCRHSTFTFHFCYKCGHGTSQGLYSEWNWKITTYGWLKYSE